MNLGTNSIQPAVLTTAQAARQLACHPKTVRSMCRDGRLMAVKLGADWRIPAKALDAFLSGEEVNADAR